MAIQELHSRHAVDPMRHVTLTSGRLSRTLIGPLLVGCLIGGCDSPSAPGGPQRLQLVHPVRSLGVPGWALLDTLTVQVLDDAGHPLPQQRLTWTIQAGNGTLTLLDTVSNLDGMTRAVWTLGPAAGVNRVHIESSTDTLAVSVTGTAFRVDALDADAGLACGLRAGDLWCWPWPGGSAPYSAGPQLAFGSTFPGPRLVVAGHAFTALAVSGTWVCGIPAGQPVECYPRDTTLTRFDPPVPAMRALAGSGYATICGLAVSDSTPWCWSPGEGAGSVRHVLPAPALLDLSVDDGASGLVGMACGRTVDSLAHCWGIGPVGDSTIANRSAPVPVAGARTFVELATGHGFACGRRANTEVWCWGQNTYRVLGHDGPQALVPELAATAIQGMRAAAYTVGVFQGPQVARWGQFQFGDPAGNPLTPLSPFQPNAVAAFANDDVSCLRLQTGEVACYHELWIFSSTLDIDTYLPVQPVPDQAS